MPFPAPLRCSSLAAALTVVGTSLLTSGSLLPPARGASLFQAVELNPANLVLVAAPIGDGTRAQLNIYEQLNDRRPCFAVAEGPPALVEPLLATFDFTGICGRFLDANGYSLRIADTDLAPGYRLSVVRFADDNLLLAVPTQPGLGPEMVVARTNGPGTDYLRLDLEPGWRLMRRAYNGRNLGHVYLFRDSWPGAVADTPEPARLEEPATLQPAEAEAAQPVPLGVELGSDSLLMGP